MQDQELFDNGPPSIFDDTMLTGYHKCPRFSYWFLRGLDYHITPSYFIFGRALGNGLGAWHEQQNSVSSEVRLLNAQAKIIKVWDEEQAPDIEFVDRKNNPESCLTMLQAYVKAHPHEQWEQVKKGAELGFVLPIPGTPFSYAGAIDAYIRWPSYGGLIREDKTTGGYITQGFVNQWDHRSQITGYFWALRQFVEEEPFGVLMNLGSKSNPKNTDDKFLRSIVKKSDLKLEQFVSETVTLIDDYRREWDTWFWPKLGERSPYSCAGGPGLSVCLYRRLCLEELNPWELDDQDILAGSNYRWREKAWKPWEREGDDS